MRAPDRSELIKDELAGYFSQHFVTLGWTDKTADCANENDGEGRHFFA